VTQADRTPAGARIAAVLALLAAAAALLALLALVARNAFALLLAVASLAVAGGAGWLAITRRGAARSAALVCAAAALAGGVVALVVLDAADDLLVVVAVLAVFAVVASTALRARSRAKRGPAPPGRRPAGRRVLLMNPRSGGGKVGQFDLESEARRRGIATVLLAPGDDLQALAREAVRGADAIGMAGGDGSQALVAQIAAEHDVPYVCIPAGTRNHLALDLGLDRDDVIGALDGFTDGLERRVDLAEVNGRIFVNNASLGVYAEIVQSDAYRDAKRETVEQMLPDLLGPNATPFDLRFTGPDGRAQQSAQLVLVSNNPYELDRLSGGGTRPRLDTARLGIVAITIADAAQAAALVALEAVRQVRRFPGWLEWTAAEFEVESGHRVAIAIDGEALAMDPPLRFRVLPGALTVRLPAGATGRSPAAKAATLGPSTLKELVRIARGRR
jgi:diacylglycerol kinase family enzyme